MKLRDYQKRIYETVLEAQKKAKSTLKDGVEAREVDHAARSIIESKGLKEYFIHGLGHGLGLEIHEPPRITPESKEKIKINFTITIEPGVYIPDFGGIRIEDTVLVRKYGFENLTEFPYDLETFNL